MFASLKKKIKDNADIIVPVTVITGVSVAYVGICIWAAKAQNAALAEHEATVNTINAGLNDGSLKTWLDSLGNIHIIPTESFPTN